MYGFANTIAHRPARVALSFALCLLVAMTTAFALASEASAVETLASGTTATTTGKATTVKKKAKKVKKGNMDKYIGLGKSKMVFATGRVAITIHTKPSARSAKKSSFQRKSSIVVDTSKMKKGKNYKWLKVKLRGKARGYVKASQVKLTIIDLKTFGLDTRKKKNKRRAQICRYGLKYLGVPYSHTGGPIWDTCDCGAFVKHCYNHAGYKFKSGNLGYLLNHGKPVSRKKLKPGDMVFYPSGSRSLAHAAIYIGKGLIMNQSGAFGTHYPRGGLRVSLLDYRSPTCNRFRNGVGN